MERLIRLVLAAACLVSAVGCGPKEQPIAVSPQSEAKAKEAAAGWSPEMVAKFKEAKAKEDNGDK